MSNYIFNFIFKTSQYPWKKFLSNDRFFLKRVYLSLWFLRYVHFKVLRKPDCERFIYLLKKFQELKIKSLFLIFQKNFQQIIFQYLKNHKTKIVHWPHNGIIIESSKLCGKKNGQIYRNQDNGCQFFQITAITWIP